MKRGSIFETDGIPRMSEALPLAMQHLQLCFSCFRLAERRNLQLAQACLLSWVSALLMCQVCRR